jgi:hypothetical protein
MNVLPKMEKIGFNANFAETTRILVNKRSPFVRIARYRKSCRRNLRDPVPVMTFRQRLAQNQNSVSTCVSSLRSLPATNRGILQSLLVTGELKHIVTGIEQHESRSRERFRLLCSLLWQVWRVPKRTRTLAPPTDGYFPLVSQCQTGVNCDVRRTRSK